MSKKLKIIFNAASMIPPLTGIGRYSTKIAEAMETEVKIQGTVNKVMYFHGLNLIQNIPLQKLINQTEEASTIFSIVYKQINAITGIDLYSVRKKLSKIPIFQNMVYNIRLNLLKHNSKKASKGCLYHETNYTLLPFDGLSIASIPDLSWYHHREWHPKDRIKHFDKEMPKTLSRADHFITISYFVKNEMVSVLGINPDKISVTHLGVDPCYRPHTKEELSPLKTLELTMDKYFLLIGSIEPRKNLRSALLAYSRLPSAVKKEYMLVHVGPSGWLNSDLLPLIQNLKRKKQFRSLGYLNEELLPFVYSGAKALIFPSLYEGFGLPPLEAMASGVPVVASNCSSIPEVVGSAGCLVEPDDEKVLTESIFRIAEDGLYAAELRKRGLQQAAKFSWEKTAADTLNIYQKVFGAQ